MMFSNLLTMATMALTATALPTSPAPAARGIPGGVQIINNLGQDVYLWSVSDFAGPLQTVPANGGAYAENWQINPNGGGISIKISTNPADLASVLQFEYTNTGDVVFWDLSSINLALEDLFRLAGFGVSIDDASCPVATCAPGDIYCAESYQFPDDHNTRACGSGAAFTLTLG